MKNVVVIGAGFSGLSAACYLAKAGYKVTVIEKNEGPGGRCRVWSESGFVFDMGPSWYWMPDVFERFFSNFGKKVSDFYTLQRLDPSYRILFKEENWDVPAGTEQLARLMEEKEPGAGAKLQTFLEEAKYKYEVGINRLVYKPGRKLNELFDAELIKGVFKLQVFRSISSHIRSLFKDKRIIQMLEFPVLFLGAKPENTPALYSLMNYADIALGTWYPQGGMYKIIEGIYDIARELGVEFHFNEPVLEVRSEGRKAREVITARQSYQADIIVGSADYHHMDEKLLGDKRNYSENYWDKRVMAPSSLIYYLGLDTKVEGLLHHNLFFDSDFSRHAEEIYDDPKWPEDPLFYVCCPSKTDSSVAPAHGENLFILIPLAPALDDPEQTREIYFNRVMERLEQKTGQKLRQHVVVKRSYAHSNFMADYNSYKGNAYGLANTLGQTAHLKPSVKNKHLDNFYYTGQLTLPGPGMPPALISGEVVANEIIKEHFIKAEI